MPQTVTDPALRDRISEIQRRLADGLPRLDPHHRLAGRPVSYHVFGGQTLEIVYHDVPRIESAELAGLQRLLGDQCACTIIPQTAETLTVRLVVPLKS